MQVIRMAKKAVRYTILCMIVWTLVVMSSASCTVTIHRSPEISNVFEEMYYDFNTNREMIDKTESFTYYLETWDFGDPWSHGSPAMFSYGRDYDIYCTRDDATITFVYEARPGYNFYYYSYRYSLETKELTYATKLYNSDVQTSFLFDQIWMAWYQESGSQFSPDDWGEYRLVLPRNETTP